LFVYFLNVRCVGTLLLQRTSIDYLLIIVCVKNPPTHATACGGFYFCQFLMNSGF